MKTTSISTFVIENPSKQNKPCICIRGVDTYSPFQAYTVEEVQEIISHLQGAINKTTNICPTQDQMCLFE